jgi:hypothetical protein
VQSDPLPQSDLLLMEGRHAIFAEKWIVSYVRSIRSTDRWVKVHICPIPTRGLYGKNDIEIGCIYEYLTLRKEIWAGHGYCGWSVYFAPLIIDEVLRRAASFPRRADLRSRRPRLRRPPRRLKETPPRIARTKKHRILTISTSNAGDP